MPRINVSAILIFLVFVCVLGFWSGNRVASVSISERACDELSELIKNEIHGITQTLKHTESLDDFNTCVNELSHYEAFAEESLLQIVDVLKRNRLRRRASSVFGEENFRLSLLQYFASISDSGLPPLIELAVDTSLDEQTRVVASEAIGLVARNTKLKSGTFASMIEIALRNESTRKNSLLYHKLLQSYCEIAEPSDVTQSFLLEVISSDDFQAKAFGVNLLCKLHPQSPKALHWVKLQFGELYESDSLSPDLVYPIIEAYGKLGLFCETIDSYLVRESSKSRDPLWRIHCLDALMKTRANSMDSRDQILAEFQDSLQTRPVSPVNCIIVNKILRIISDWVLEDLKAAEPHLINAVEEHSLDDLQALAFELLGKFDSERLPEIALVSANSENRCLRFLALKQLQLLQRSVEIDEMAFLIEFAVSSDELLEHRVDALSLVSSTHAVKAASIRQLETLWKSPVSPRLRFLAYRLWKAFKNTP